MFGSVRHESIAGQLASDAGKISYLEMTKHDRVDEYSPAHSDRPTGNAKAITLGAEIAREDFCGHQEGNCTYTNVSLRGTYSDFK